MIENASGLVLRTRLLTDTSLIVHWLTRDLGRIATVAKGARRPNSPFRGKLDVFFHAQLSFSRSRKSELHTLREVRLLETHPTLRLQLLRLQRAAYCAALIELTTETETPIPVVHDLLAALLQGLAQPVAPPALVLAFELRLLEELGLAPNVDRLSRSAGVLARFLVEGDWAALPQARGTPEEWEELERFLHGFLIYHLGRVPRGRHQALSAETAGPIPGSTTAPPPG